MEFGPVGIEQASGQTLQRFAQIGHHRIGSASSSLSHGLLPAPSFPGHCPAKLLKSGREWLVIAVLLRVRLIARHARFARWLCPALPAYQSPTAAIWRGLAARNQARWRVIARKEGNRVRLYSRPGNDLTHRFPLIV